MVIKLRAALLFVCHALLLSLNYTKRNVTIYLAP